MKKKIQFIAILFSVCISIFSTAQTRKEILTIDQLIKIGLDSSKALHLSDAKLQLAKAKYDQALDAVLPSVKLNAGYTRLSEIDPPKFLFPGSSTPVALFPVYVNNYSVSLSASETIFSGFRLKYAKESTNLLQQAAKFDFNKDKEEIIFNLINAYFNIYKLTASEKVVEENIKQINERVRVTQRAMDNGLATQNDVLRWQLQSSNLELTQLDIQNNLQVANYNLKLLLGYDDSRQLEIDTNEVNTIRNTTDIQSYLDLAAKNRNDLNAAIIRSNASYNNYKIAKNSYLPRISIQGEALDARPNQRFIPPVDKFNSTWAAGISLNWDLMNLYSNRHNVDEFQSYYDQSKIGVSIMSDAIKIEVNQNFLAYNQSLKKVEVMVKSIQQAQENFRLTDSRYKNNLVILSELLEANNIIVQSQINLEIAKADVQIAYYRLLKSSGNIK